MSNANLETDIININPYNLRIDTSKFKQTQTTGTGPNYGNGQLTFSFVKQGYIDFSADNADNVWHPVVVSNDNCWGNNGNGILKVVIKARMKASAVTPAYVNLQFLQTANNTALAGTDYNYNNVTAQVNNGTSGTIIVKTGDTSGGAVRWVTPTYTIDYNVPVWDNIGGADTIATISSESYLTYLAAALANNSSPVLYFTDTAAKTSDIRGFQLSTNSRAAIDYLEYKIWRIS